MSRTRFAAAIAAALTLAASLLAPTAAPAAPGPVRVAAVGDIACKNPPSNNRKVCQYDDVAAAIKRGDYDRFLPLGDIQYEAGAYRDFVDNYDRYFGSLRSITEPVPGNHEYGTADAAGYFRYFGAAAHGPGGYYSYDLGAWHIVALNSAICPAITGCAPRPPTDRVAARGPRRERRALHPRVLAPSALRLAEVPERRLDRGLRVPAHEALLGCAVGSGRRRGARGPQPQLLAMEADGR